MSIASVTLIVASIVVQALPVEESVAYRRLLTSSSVSDSTKGENSSPFPPQSAGSSSSDSKGASGKSTSPFPPQSAGSSSFDSIGASGKNTSHFAPQSAGSSSFDSTGASEASSPSGVHDAVSNATSHGNSLQKNQVGSNGSSVNVWVVVVIFLSAAVLLVLIYRWTSVSYSRVGQAVVPPPVSASTVQGLELAAIEVLPVVTFPPPPRRLGEVPDSTCPICLEDFSIGVEIRVLPCHHFFHPACIEMALLLRPRCPYCSQTVTAIDV